MKRDTIEKLQLGGFLTFCLFPIFGLIVVVAIILEQIAFWFFRFQ
jgi:hypothetical protein